MGFIEKNKIMCLSKFLLSKKFTVIWANNFYKIFFDFYN